MTIVEDTIIITRQTNVDILEEDLTEALVMVDADTVDQEEARITEAIIIRMVSATFHTMVHHHLKRVRINRAIYAQGHLQRIEAQDAPIDNSEDVDMEQENNLNAESQ
ncbi:hypothetical protein HII13_003357 [Brettanomyces bruxellensis]|nr:hypothetical protein HII13_003357 [Brettanomyces bruxellensis]